MASVVKKLVLKYKKEVQESQQWNTTSPQHQVSLLRSQLISRRLFQIVVLIATSDQEIRNITPKRI